MTQRQQYAVVSRDWLEALAAQKPEKPDHWSSCSQCERATENAQDFLAAPPPPDQVLSSEQRKEFIRQMSFISEADRDQRAGLVEAIERAVLKQLGAKNV